MLKEEILTVRANLGELLGTLNEEQALLVGAVRSVLLSLADMAGNMEKERAATAAIVRLILCADPWKVIQVCQRLRDRFEKAASITEDIITKEDEEIC